MENISEVDANCDIPQEDDMISKPQENENSVEANAADSETKDESGIGQLSVPQNLELLGRESTSDPSAAEEIGNVLQNETESIDGSTANSTNEASSDTDTTLIPAVPETPETPKTNPPLSRWSKFIVQRIRTIPQFFIDCHYFLSKCIFPTAPGFPIEIILTIEFLETFEVIANGFLIVGVLACVIKLVHMPMNYVFVCTAVSTLT
jgi:hypothetical protein